MKKLLILAAACAAVLTSLVPSATAITGNYEKDFVNDAVGLVVFYSDADPNDPFSHRCSGTLISAKVLVTAGHCTEGVDEGRVYFQQAVGPNYDPAAFGGKGGDPTTGYPYENGYTFSRADNYGFHNFAGFPDHRDVGVVILDGAGYTPPSGNFGILPSAGAVDAYIAANKNKQDIRFLSSGYGLSDQDPVPVSFRERLMANSYLVQDSSAKTNGINLRTTANPSQGKGGTCNGDSGGPVFIAGTKVIAAVTSFGYNAQCKGLDYSYRLDRAEILSWINNPNRPDDN